MTLYPQDIGMIPKLRTFQVYTLIRLSLWCFILQIFMYRNNANSITKNTIFCKWYQCSLTLKVCQLTIIGWGGTLTIFEAFRGYFGEVWSFFMKSNLVARIYRDLATDIHIECSDYSRNKAQSAQSLDVVEISRDVFLGSFWQLTGIWGWYHLPLRSPKLLDVWPWNFYQMISSIIRRHEIRKI